MLKQSSLGGNVRWTFPFAAELRVDPSLPLSAIPCLQRIARRKYPLDIFSRCGDLSEAK